MKTRSAVNNNPTGWKGIAPKERESHEKTVNGKEYIYHCPHHGKTKWVLKISKEIEHMTGCRAAAAAARRSPRLRNSRRKASSQSGNKAESAGIKPKKSAKTTTNPSKQPVAATPPSTTLSSPVQNKSAEVWGRRLQQTPCYLTDDGQSWYILAKKWYPTPSEKVFEQEWSLHPTKRHILKVYGRETEESRWSQSWGVNYAYSGAVNRSRPLEDSSILPDLMERINNLLYMETEECEEEKKSPYNGCLQNWYTPEDKIGLHSDDERSLIQKYPIWSLSWGGTRRFLFRRKKSKKQPSPNPPEKAVELWLEDGDLILMGGTCQLTSTHKHEVPAQTTKERPNNLQSHQLDNPGFSLI